MDQEKTTIEPTKPAALAYWFDYHRVEDSRCCWWPWSSLMSKTRLDFVNENPCSYGTDGQGFEDVE